MNAPLPPNDSIKALHVSPKRTICEVHRMIYDRVYDLSKQVQDPALVNEIVALLEEAFQMAKKMNNKLFQYKNNWDDGWFDKQNEKDLMETIKKRIQRDREAADNK